ncbi:proteinase-activated receptor 3 [Mugil cephalus]|uniref:proteinase-activated receptor 3 n=1 Tax=Mugil cephalus TaxID=48193 RepID=UPI001FB7CA4F|nr:proteinase-activated receptor 3 [Mugil cephalus]
MGKVLLLVVVLVLLTGATLQDDGHSKKARPRTFFGDLVTVAKPDLNGTQAPFSSSHPPALELQHNSTAAYLQGALSTRVIPIIYILIVTFGIPANVGILCLLATKIRKVSSAILYCSLAVSDLLLLLSLLFKTHYHLLGNNWVLGEAACRVVTACFYGNLYCSALTLACISIKRYLAVVYPFTYKSFPKRTCTTWVSLAVWALFVAAIIPELVTQQTYLLPQLNRTTCHDVLALKRDTYQYLLSYNVVLGVLGLLMPLVVATVCFSRIICELSRSHRDWTMYIRTSSLVFGIFLVCFIPAGVLHLVHYAQLFADGTQSVYIYFNVAVCLCCLHACLDPFLFVFMSRSSGNRLHLTTSKGKSLSVSI